MVAPRGCDVALPRAFRLTICDFEQMLQHHLRLAIHDTHEAFLRREARIVLDGVMELYSRGWSVVSLFTSTTRTPERTPLPLKSFCMRLESPREIVDLSFGYNKEVCMSSLNVFGSCFEEGPQGRRNGTTSPEAALQVVVASGSPNMVLIKSQKRVACPRHFVFEGEGPDFSIPAHHNVDSVIESAEETRSSMLPILDVDENEESSNVFQMEEGVPSPLDVVVFEEEAPRMLATGRDTESGGSESDGTILSTDDVSTLSDDTSHVCLTPQEEEGGMEECSRVQMLDGVKLMDAPEEVLFVDTMCSESTCAQSEAPRRIDVLKQQGANLLAALRQAEMNPGATSEHQSRANNSVQHHKESKQVVAGLIASGSVPKAQHLVLAEEQDVLRKRERSQYSRCDVESEKKDRFQTKTGESNLDICASRIDVIREEIGNEMKRFKGEVEACRLGLDMQISNLQAAIKNPQSKLANKRDRSRFGFAQDDEDIVFVTRSVIEGQEDTPFFQRIRRVLANECIGMDKLASVRPLGSGGMACIHSCTIDKSTYFALKEPLDEEFAEEFDHEVSIMLGLNHQNIVKIEKIVVNEDNPTKVEGILMEIMETNLFKYLNIYNGLSFQQIVHIAKQIVDALHYMHEKGVAHLDLKPTNILIERTKDFPTVKLADFGISRAFNADGSFPEDTDFGYSATHSAPEIMIGSAHCSKSADIYSLGIVLSELFLGTVVETDTDQMVRAFNAKLDIHSVQQHGTIPQDGWNTLIHSCLSLEPIYRPSIQDVKSMVDVLAREYP